MTITSTAFTQNDVIPSKYTCDGQNINPPLTFSHVPKEAHSLVLIVDDPDAVSGLWVHWLLYNIPSSTIQILENSVPQYSMNGENSFGTTSYGGPCPPSGNHRYFFKLYALDSQLNVSQNAKKDEIEKAMEGHIIEKAELIGKYQRSSS